MIKLTLVDEKNLEAFKPFMPAEIWGYIGAEDHMGLGALLVDETKPKEGAAAGVLVFTTRVSPFGAEPSSKDYGTIVTLDWIYVAEALRDRGIGGALMDKFYELMTKADVQQLMTNVGYYTDYHDLISFLEHYQFVFDYNESGPIYLEREQVEALRSGVSYPKEFVKPLGRCDPEEVKKWLTKRLSREQSIYRRSLPPFIEMYDPDLSSVCFSNDGQCRGILLVTLNPGKTIAEPVYIWGTDAGQFRKLIDRSVDAYLEMAGQEPELKVIMEAPDDDFLERMEYLIGRPEMLPVLTGVYLSQEMIEGLIRETVEMEEDDHE